MRLIRACLVAGAMGTDPYDSDDLLSWMDDLSNLEKILDPKYIISRKPASEKRGKILAIPKGEPSKKRKKQYKKKPHAETSKVLKIEDVDHPEMLTWEIKSPAEEIDELEELNGPNLSYAALKRINKRLGALDLGTDNPSGLDGDKENFQLAVAEKKSSVLAIENGDGSAEAKGRPRDIPKLLSWEADSQAPPSPMHAEEKPSIRKPSEKASSWEFKGQEEAEQSYRAEAKDPQTERNTGQEKQREAEIPINPESGPGKGQAENANAEKSKADIPPPENASESKADIPKPEKTHKGLPDPCTTLCDGHVRCGKGGSYCKNTVCHDLYGSKAVGICSKTSGVTCGSRSPLSCGEAENIVRSSEAPPTEVENAKSKRGIINLGNTCYLGASLQLLTHLAPIRDSVLNAHEPKVDFAELRKAFLAQWIDSQNAAFDPTALMAVMNKRFKYSVKYQEDAQEAMAALLDLLENGIPQIDNLYTARYEETKVCPDCGRTSVSAFPITFINVPLPNVEGRAVSIAECFNLYFSPELLDEFKCDECGRESVRMTKRLLTSPQVLLIHLKRFEYNKDTNVYSRINSYVDVPMELDLATLANGGEGKYKLQGVMHHLGSSLDSGHYVADVRNPEDGKFYHADDSKVGMYTKEPPVSGITPYVLVYLREP